MNPSDVGGASRSKEARLPRRDWVLLPGLGLLTICLLAGLTDLVARRMFTASYGSGEDCIVFSDPGAGPRGIPGSVCREKIPEGELTEYRFNSCGHRTSIECGAPKPPGTYRIVMIGGSYAMGMRVPAEKTFAVLLPAELSRSIGRKVELYNEGMPWRPPHMIAEHFSEVLAQSPDMILWTVHPSDVWNPLLPARAQAAPSPRSSAFSTLSPYGKVKRIVGRAELELSPVSKRIGTLFRHFLYESQSQLIASYLAQPPDAAFMQKIHGPEFMRTRPAAEWQEHLREFDRDVADIVAKATDAGVPLVATMLPQRAQAAMISRGVWPTEFDPYKLDNELRSMVQRHGGTWLDILTNLRNLPNTEQDFFPLDVHPNAQGQVLISEVLGRELTVAGLPGHGGSASLNGVQQQGR